MNIFILMYKEALMEELEKFFEELRDCYLKERQNFNWRWGDIIAKNKNDIVSKNFVYYIAYNFSKNVIHGPLPGHIHSRMVLDNNLWSKKYIEYLEGK